MPPVGPGSVGGPASEGLADSPEGRESPEPAGDDDYGEEADQFFDDYGQKKVDEEDSDGSGDGICPPVENDSVPMDALQGVLDNSELQNQLNGGSKNKKVVDENANSGDQDGPHGDEEGNHGGSEAPLEATTTVDPNNNDASVLKSMIQMNIDKSSKKRVN